MKGFLLSVVMIYFAGVINCYAGDPINLVEIDKSLQRSLAYKPIVESNLNIVEPIVLKKFSVNKRKLGRLMQIGGGLLMVTGITLFQLYDSDGTINSHIGLPLAFAGLLSTIKGTHYVANHY